MLYLNCRTGRPSLSVVVWVKTQPSLASRVRAGWPSTLPARPTVSAFTTGRPVPSIFDVQDFHGLGAHLGQFQWFGGADLPLFAGSNIAADGFGMALHSLGCDLDPGRHIEFFAAFVEAGLRSYQGHHTADAGRTLCAFHDEFAIPGALAGR